MKAFYLTIGSIEVKKLRPVKAEDVIFGNDVLMFSIHVVLNEVVEQRPKAGIYFSFTIDQCDGVLIVVSHAAPADPFVIKGSDFSPISEYIYKAVRAQVDAFSKLPVVVELTL
ncbi:hypothetical protein D3C84_1028730 [compost metagenome]